MRVRGEIEKGSKREGRGMEEEKAVEKKGREGYKREGREKKNCIY